SMSVKKYVLLLLPVMLLFACDSYKEDARPNIIFIMSDDHALKAISAYDTSLLQTPNIDRLAEHGIRFDRCFCTNAICAPSRAVILTGKYSHMNGVIDNENQFDGSQPTLPGILRRAGYQTAMIGKWHLKSEPTGFDYWLVLPGQGDYYRPDFIDSLGKTTIEGYVTDIITSKGIEFIEKRDPGKPFFMMLHHKAPHRNWQPAARHLDIFEDMEFPVPANLEDRYEGKSRAPKDQEMSIARHMSLDYDLKMPSSILDLKGNNRELMFGNEGGGMSSRMKEEEYKKWQAFYTRRANEYNKLPDDSLAIDRWKYRKYMEDYLSCIHTVDENIGQLLDYLANTGLDKNTIVIYTSDQGFFLGEHGWYDKRFMYEEAHRMPLLISLPGAESSTDSHLLTNADFAPTILSLAGLKVPEDMQGESFHEILEGHEPPEWRDAVYYHYFEYPAVHSVKRHYGLRTERYKLIHFYYDIDAWELYDLKEDPMEMKNLAGDPDYAALLDEMKGRLWDLQEQYGDTTPGKYLPAMPSQYHHLAVGASYSLLYPPSERYPGTPGCLTDGIAFPEGDAYHIDKKSWCGFSGDDFVLSLDLGKEHEIKAIRVGFLQNQHDWIFAPATVEFLTSLDGIDYMPMTNELSAGPEKDDRVMKVYARAEYSGLKTRYIKVKAKNRILPDWHAGAGKPAWLFVDELLVD
ncbi:MAG TPA: sulfatase/phosphatase domain-containing protein, partial [Bacteroidales bacterium]|nr:sulfatase/phosphatase domain-containing protein [Bacteroidales bacterium]